MVRCGPPAVRKYRLANPVKMLFPEGNTNLDLDAVLKSMEEWMKKDLRDRANHIGVPPNGLLIEDWLEQFGTKWNLVWSNDHRLDLVTLAEHLKDEGAELVADVDDWFEAIPRGNLSSQGWYTRKKQEYRALLQNADRVTCSTPFLAEKFGGIVCPNFIVPEEWEWPIRPTRRAEECLIVVPAGSGRAGDYLPMESAFRTVLEMPHVKILFIGWQPDWSYEYPVGKVVTSMWWELADYPRFMRWAAPDILVSPMEHHDFNLAKSNLKWLEAGACGTCFVGEKWGEYERTVRDGETGFLSDGEKEWTETLMHVCTDSQHRKAVAEAGSAEVLRSWVWSAVSADWRKGVLGDGASLDRSVHDPGERCLTAATG